MNDEHQRNEGSKKCARACREIRQASEITDASSINEMRPPEVADM